MYSNLESYLERVAHQLKWLPPTAREAEIREVEDHLRTFIEAQQAQGVSYRDAVGESIRRFGEARGVGKALARAWHQRQPESVVRAVLAFVVAFMGQFYFWCGAIALAALVSVNSSSISLTTGIVGNLFLCVAVHLLSGFLATVIAPRRGQAAAIAAYLAVITVSLGIILLPSLDSPSHSDKPFALFSLLFFDPIVMTINLSLLSSIINVLGGTWLARHWMVRQATRQHFKLRPVGDMLPPPQGDHYGS